MNITFITDYQNMTYEFYLKQPKHIVEWELVEKLAKNPKFIRTFHRNNSHPLIRRYSHIDNEVIDDLEEVNANENQGFCSQTQIKK